MELTESNEAHHRNIKLQTLNVINGFMLMKSYDIESIFDEIKAIAKK